jgi:hypothetical protein
MKADPARAAEAGMIQQTGAGYFAMVCVYLVGSAQPTFPSHYPEPHVLRSHSC